MLTAGDWQQSTDGFVILSVKNRLKPAVSFRQSSSLPADLDAKRHAQLAKWQKRHLQHH